MAARNTPSKGGKPDKLIRDALLIAVKRHCKDDNGKKTTYLNRIATKVVTLAASGDVPAIKELFDRIDGKPAQAVELSGDAANPVAFNMISRPAKEKR